MLGAATTLPYRLRDDNREADTRLPPLRKRPAAGAGLIRGDGVTPTADANPD